MTGKIITLFLIALTVYSGFAIMDPDREPKTINDIVIPKGQKDKYVQILNEATKVMEERKIAQKEDIEKIPKYTEANQAKNKTFEVKSDKDILFKIKSYKIFKDNLIMNVYFYNKTNRAINRNIEFICVAYDSDNNGVDQFSWRKDISINPKETILIEDMNVGYVTAVGFNYLECSIK